MGQSPDRLEILLTPLEIYLPEEVMASSQGDLFLTGLARSNGVYFPKIPVGLIRSRSIKIK
jgi:hypothetical protein